MSALGQIDAKVSVERTYSGGFGVVVDAPDDDLHAELLLWTGRSLASQKAPTERGHYESVPLGLKQIALEDFKANGRVSSTAPTTWSAFRQNLLAVTFSV